MEEKDIAEKISNAGGRLYLVGGAVRDEIMNKVPHDKDYCVVGLSQDEFLHIFKEAKIVGKDFPVFMMYGNEFALARSETKISEGYKGFEITTSKEITIEEDLKRRDITINAIAKDVLTGKLIDPFNGIEDIKEKCIRHVSEAFAEDPLRVYRVARFAAQLEFNVDSKTIKLMNSLKEELSTITPERVTIELTKALETAKPSIFFNVLRKAEVLDVHFVELNNLIGVPQPLKYHPEGDVYNHTMIVLDEVASKTKSVSARFAALVHDFGKANTPKEILPQHIGHDVAGVELVENLSNRLKLPTKWKEQGKEVCKYHMKAGIFSNMKPYKQAKFINVINKTSIGLENMQYIVKADDMLNRPKINFAKLGKDVLSEFSGKKLIQRGIEPNIVGKDKFLTLLFEEQAKIIKIKEERGGYYE